MLIKPGKLYALVWLQETNNLLSVFSNVGEAVPTCSFWPPTNSTNYRKSIQNFLSSRLANRQWHLQQANHSSQSNPCTEVEAQKEDFNAVSQTDFSSVVQARLQGFGVKIANFSPLYCIAIPRRDLSTKKTKPNNNRKQTRKPQSHVRI